MTILYTSHQWMFITDTVDAVYRPDSWVPEALFDQLADMVRDLPTRSNLASHVIQATRIYLF